MKTAELLETLRTRQPLSWRQVRDRLPLSLPRQSRLDLASDDRYPRESDYGGGSAIVDFLDMKDGWAGPGTFAPSRMIIRNARAFLSRVSAVSRIVPCVSPSPRGTINITYYLDEDRDISVEVGDDELASSTNLDRDDLFLVWNRDDAIPRQLLEALAQGRPLTRSWRMVRQMTSAEDYPDHVDDAEQLLRAVLTRHHIERIPLPDGTLRLRISRDFFLPFRSDEIGLSAFRELAGKDTIRRHADSMFSYCGFGRTQCADMREIDAEVEAAPIPKAPEHANIDLSGLLTEEDIRLYQAASEATPHGKIRPVNPHACRKVYAVLDLLRERFTVEWDPESKGYRKAIRRPR